MNIYSFICFMMWMKAMLIITIVHFDLEKTSLHEQMGYSSLLSSRILVYAYRITSRSLQLVTLSKKLWLDAMKVAFPSAWKHYDIPLSVVRMETAKNWGIAVEECVLPLWQYLSGSNKVNAIPQGLPFPRMQAARNLSSSQWKHHQTVNIKQFLQGMCFRGLEFLKLSLFNGVRKLQMPMCFWCVAFLEDPSASILLDTLLDLVCSLISALVCTSRHYWLFEAGYVHVMLTSYSPQKNIKCLLSTKAWCLLGVASGYYPLTSSNSIIQKVRRAGRSCCMF